VRLWRLRVRVRICRLLLWVVLRVRLHLRGVGSESREYSRGAIKVAVRDAGCCRAQEVVMLVSRSLLADWLVLLDTR